MRPLVSIAFRLSGETGLVHSVKNKAETIRVVSIAFRLSSETGHPDEVGDALTEAARLHCLSALR